MSQYTTEVRWIVESLTPNNGSLYDRIRLAAPKIFSFQFPIWVESYRIELESKILLHYITREIAYETVGLWKLKLQARLNVIMPYYIELYNTTKKSYDYLTDTDIQETYEYKKDAEFESTGEESTKGNTLASDLPQANYAGKDYATDLSESSSSANTRNTSSENTTDSYNRTRKGLSGRSKTELLVEYRNAILNIDEQIIEELADLFMGLY